MDFCKTNDEKELRNDYDDGEAIEKWLKKCLENGRDVLNPYRDKARIP